MRAWRSASRPIGGFSVREIARAFLSEESTIAQRIVRAKRQIRDRRLTLELPGASDLERRLDSVLDVVYLMFNEGYAAHEGEELDSPGPVPRSAAPRPAHRGLVDGGAAGACARRADGLAGGAPAGTR